MQLLQDHAWSLIGLLCLQNTPWGWVKVPSQGLWLPCLAWPSSRSQFTGDFSWEYFLIDHFHTNPRLRICFWGAYPKARENKHLSRWRMLVKTLRDWDDSGPSRATKFPSLLTLLMLVGKAGIIASASLRTPHFLRLTSNANLTMKLFLISKVWVNPFSPRVFTACCPCLGFLIQIMGIWYLLYHYHRIVVMNKWEDRCEIPH